jgi:hypothetical protein
MLAAFIDDSGSQGEGPVFILGGYVANTNDWKRFSDQWQMALDLPPKLKLVKIQHALRLEEGWGRFKDTQRDERLKRFASIIHSHVMFSVLAVAGWDDLRRVKKEFAKYGKFTAYGILFHGLMAAIVHHLKNQKIKEKIDFVFDEQGLLGKMATADFDWYRDRLPPELGEFIGGRPIHRNDEEFLPLQAAHTIAWLYRRYAHENNLTGDLHTWMPSQACLRKLRKIPCLYQSFPYERLSEVLKEAAELRNVVK